ncbi:MAG: TonB-dependent receptor [Pseudomonadota bacterium]
MKLSTHQSRLPLVVAVAAACVSGGLPTLALAQSEGPVEEVISVGTRRAERSAAETPAPVDVIGQDELLNQGNTDIQNILRTSVPSFNVNSQPISDAATLIRPANLRGLAPDETLVLVNGKRRHRAAVISFLGGGISDGAQGPDISVIPAIALKQVEVLRDGAASQYGSDAIAGVINFVLKDASEGASFEIEGGEAYAGDGEQFSISGNVGFPLWTDGSFVNISAEYSEINDTIRSVQRDDALGLIAAGNADVMDISVNGVTDEFTQIWGQPNINDDISVFVNAGLPLNEYAELYAFGNYAERNVDGGFFYRNPTNRGGVYSNDGGANLLVGDLTPDGSGNCPVVPVVDGLPDPDGLAALIADPNCFSFVETIPGGFTPRFGGDLEDASVAVGLRGEIPWGNGLTYDLSYYWGENEINFFINNTLNASLGPDSPRDFNPGGYVQTDNNIELNLGYGIPNSVFASDIGIAFGFQYREEEFEIIAGDANSFEIGPLAAPSDAFPAGQGFSSSSNGFGGFTAASAGTNSQSNYALYFETETDITDRLVLQGAVRFEDYDTFGSTTNWKLGGLFKASDNVTLRSTISTGFKAPTAGQANVTNITTAFTGGVLNDQGTIPLSSAAGQFIADRLEAQTGVRPELGPEDSVNFSIGAAFDAGPISFTLDYFRIEVDDRISISTQQDFQGELIATADENGVMLPDNPTTSQALFALDDAGILNAADFAGSEDLASFGFFNNSFDTRTQGIDLVANTDFTIYDGSSSSLALAFNWTDTEVTDRGLDTAAPLSLGRQRQLEENIPNFRGNLTFNHFQGPFRGMVRLNYWGEFFECHLDATNDDPALGGCDLPIDSDAIVTVDMEAAATMFDNRIEVVLGAQNVFDTFPDENPFAGIVGALYPTTSPSGFFGGLWYLKLRGQF